MSETLFDRVVRALGRHRALGRVIETWRRRRLLAALSRAGDPGAVLAPAELLPSLPPSAVAHRDSYAADPESFAAVVIRTDRIAEVDARVLRRVRDRLRCHFLNGRYALFRVEQPADGEPPRMRALRARMESLLEPAARGFAHHRPGPPGPVPRSSRPLSSRSRAALVTTVDRPAALRRALPQIVSLGMPVLVVDDGSTEPAREANRSLCRAQGAAYLLLPSNRGLPAALNAGLGYWLADPAVEWISYFQDDVDVDPRLIDALAPLEDPDERPILTGYDAEEHPDVETTEIAGVRVKLKRSTPAVHLHAHASYWASVLPIPSPYLGAPKPHAGASMEDWWITTHAPRSAEKRGLLVACIPGLVRTFLWHRDDSTWDNAGTPSCEAS